MIALILVWAIPTGMRAQQAATAKASLVFDGVTVVDVERGNLASNQRVVIAGNRIRTVGDIGVVKVPRGARVVDARGKYLIPGLWDMHVHPDRSTDYFYRLFITQGITGIRDAGSSVPLDTLRLWRREILAGTRVGPVRQILSGPSVNGSLFCDFSVCVLPENSNGSPSDSLQQRVKMRARARHIVDSLYAAGADMIKSRAITRETYFVIAAEARRLGIPFGGHATGPGDPNLEGIEALEASNTGASIIDHIQATVGALKPGQLDLLCWTPAPSAGVQQCQSAAERFRRNGTWLVPTLTAALSHTRGGPPLAQRIWRRSIERAKAFPTGWLPQGNWLRDLVQADSSIPSGSRSDSLGAMYIMQRAGLPVLAGTDMQVMELFGSKEAQAALGFWLHPELAMYVAEGLTPLNALQSATLNPAKLLHATDSLGTVAPGKLADLVLLDADPLADITNTTTIRAVVANGRYFDRAALDGLLAEVQTMAKVVPWLRR